MAKQVHSLNIRAHLDVQARDVVRIRETIDGEDYVVVLMPDDQLHEVMKTGASTGPYPAGRCEYCGR